MSPNWNLVMMCLSLSSNNLRYFNANILARETTHIYVLHDAFRRRYVSLMPNYNFMIGTDRKREDEKT